MKKRDMKERDGKERKGKETEEGKGIGQKGR
jgi:hypothetical protein